jgi:predicted N-acetyltransferase YhbS
VIRIARATAQDCDGILECLRLAFAAYEAEYSRAAFEDTILSAERLQRRMAEMTVLVAHDENGSIVGTVAFNVLLSAEGHLRGMAVRPSEQGSGIARQLLRAAEQELAALKCERVTLDTTEPLKRAARFYEANGYRASGKVSDFFGMPLYEYVKPLCGREGRKDP